MCHTCIVYGPSVVLHVTHDSQLNAAELMSGQVVTYIPERSYEMLLCTVSLADRAASYASAQGNRYQFGLTSTLQCLLNGVQKRYYMKMNVSRVRMKQIRFLFSAAVAPEMYFYLILSR